MEIEGNSYPLKYKFRYFKPKLVYKFFYQTEKISLKYNFRYFKSKLVYNFSYQTEKVSLKYNFGYFKPKSIYNFYYENMAEIFIDKPEKLIFRERDALLPELAGKLVYKETQNLSKDLVEKIIYKERLGLVKSLLDKVLSLELSKVHIESSKRDLENILLDVFIKKITFMELIEQAIAINSDILLKLEAKDILISQMIIFEKISNEILVEALKNIEKCDNEITIDTPKAIEECIYEINVELSKDIEKQTEEIMLDSSNSLERDVNGIIVKVTKNIEKHIEEVIIAVLKNMEKYIYDIDIAIPKPIEKAVYAVDIATPEPIERPAYDIDIATPEPIERPAYDIDIAMPKPIERPVYDIDIAVPEPIERPAYDINVAVPKPIERPAYDIDISIPKPIERPAYDIDVAVNNYLRLYTELELKRDIPHNGVLKSRNEIDFNENHWLYLTEKLILKQRVQKKYVRTANSLTSYDLQKFMRLYTDYRLFKHFNNSSFTQITALNILNIINKNTLRLNFNANLKRLRSNEFLKTQSQCLNDFNSKTHLEYISRLEILYEISEHLSEFNSLIEIAKGDSKIKLTVEDVNLLIDTVSRFMNINAFGVAHQSELSLETSWDLGKRIHYISKAQMLKTEKELEKTCSDDILTKESLSIAKEAKAILDKIPFNMIIEECINSLSSIDLELIVEKDSTAMTMYKRGWFIRATLPTDLLILPNIDYPYSKSPAPVEDYYRDWDVYYWHFEEISNVIETHPVPEGSELGTTHIEVSIEIMVDMVNILLMLWTKFYTAFEGWHGVGAIKGLMIVIYNWITLETSIEEMKSKKSYNDYMRCYRWLRWEAEMMIHKAREDYTIGGNRWVELYVLEIFRYLWKHHFDTVPLFKSIALMDLMRDIVRDGAQGEIDIVLDKLKGMRFYSIEEERRDYIE